MSTPTLIVGGTGYVAGELVRLVTQHPRLDLVGISSASRAGTEVAEAFPHLASATGSRAFLTQDELGALIQGPQVALFSAAPHGISGGVVARLLKTAAAGGTRVQLVDVSADFRFRTLADFQAVYPHPHGAPELLPRFVCALPEHLKGVPDGFVAHPGCFATAMLVGLVPLLKHALITGPVYASGITGSTGAGRAPSPTTHHPERHANLFAYNPLRHRHAPEVVQLCGQLTGRTPELNFVAHGGPFARGIHLTLQARLTGSHTADGLRDLLATFYQGHEFVRVVAGEPRVKDVAGSNYCHVGVAVSASPKGQSVAVLVTLDNLVKGAAGGALQWMNRLLGLPETTGLTAPAPGWI